MNRIIVALIGAFAITAECSYVSLVKQGHFLNDASTTIGQAFDNSFGSPKWRESISAKGQNFVEFKGDVDVDFWDILAKSIVGASGDALMDPYNSSPYMDACLGRENSLAFKKDIISSMYELAFMPQSELVELIAGYFIRFLAEKSNRLTVQFMFNERKDSDFDLYYYGFDDDLANCDLHTLIPTSTFLRFVYSSHVYTDFNVNKIASKIVDQASSLDSKVLNAKAKEKTKGMSKSKLYALIFALNAEPRVVKKIQNDKKVAEEKKHQEETEVARKNEELVNRKKKQKNENLKKAIKEIVPAMKKYKQRMDAYKTAAENHDERFARYPDWNVIGYNPPKSDFFYYTKSDGYVWDVIMQSRDDLVGVHCHWIISCYNTEGCECNVSEDCKDITPDLSSICNVEYDSY